MEVTFTVTDKHGQQHHERELAAKFDELKADLETVHDADGMLLLYNDTGSYEVTPLRDELGALVESACFDVASELAVGRNALLSMVSRDQTVRFDVEGDDIVIQGDRIDGDRCSARSLLEALVACGERFVILLRRLHGADPRYQDYLARWDAAAARARNALQ